VNSADGGVRATRPVIDSQAWLRARPRPSITVADYGDGVIA